MKHTPTPWKWKGNRPSGYLLMGPDGSLGEVYICGEPKNCNAEANADFIVRAVNSHEALLDALKAVEENLAHVGLAGTVGILRKVCKEAIAKAEE